MLSKINLKKVKSYKKINQKLTELDFLAKTFDYKKLQEVFFNKKFELNIIPDITYQEILMQRPSLDNNLNILGDSKYWAESPLNEKSLKRNRTYTDTHPNKTQRDLSLLPLDTLENENDAFEKDAKMELSDNEKDKYSENHADSLGSDSHSEKSIIIEPHPENRFSQYLFQKKVALPIFGLCDIYDLNLYKTKKKSRKTMADKLIERICSKDLNWIRSKAAIRRKVLNRLILSIYLSFYSKEDYSDDLLEFVYYDFLQRYGLKIVSDRKFVEFLCSVIYSESSKRCSNFLRFICLGQKINKKNFSKRSFEVYLESLSVIMNSKLGASPLEDSSERIMIPAAKAIELVKEKLENLERIQIMRTISIIEFKSVQDPKKISVIGLIDSEMVLELMVDAVEGQKSKYLDGLQFIINTIKYKEPKDSVMKFEVSMIIRAIFPLEVQKFEKYYEDIQSLPLPELCLYCVENSLFSLVDISSYYTDEDKTVTEVQALVNDSMEELLHIANELDSNEQFMKTIPQKAWDSKLKNLAKGVGSRKTYETMLAFNLFSNELKRIYAMFL